MDPHKLRMRHSSVTSDWRTPHALVLALRDYVGGYAFSYDLAADASSTVCVDYLGPGSSWGENALAVDWAALPPNDDGRRCGFLNPPYSLTAIQELKKHGVLHNDPQIAALRIENWARKAFEESLRGFTTIGVFPYAPQTKWFREYVMGHTRTPVIADFPDIGLVRMDWRGHAALDYWRLSHRVPFLRADGSPAGGANVNTCIIHWGPNPGFVGPWVPSGRYWSYR